PTRARTPDATPSTPRWSPSLTVSSSATRTAVTRRPALRSASLGSSSPVLGMRDDSFTGSTYSSKGDRFKLTNDSTRVTFVGKPPRRHAGWHTQSNRLITVRIKLVWAEGDRSHGGREGTGSRVRLRGRARGGAAGERLRPHVVIVARARADAGT